MDLQALQATLRAFAAERNWQQFHTPKNLAMALMIEAAELAEIFQWMTPEQSVDARTDEVLQSRIGEELADVLIYLLQLADHTSVDLELAVADKLVKNATKYPRIGEGLTSGPVAIKSGQAHVFIDSHVVASLRKSKNKPTRKARLHGAVKSLLSGGETDSANVERVVNRMIADGYLSIDDKGSVVMKL